MKTVTGRTQYRIPVLVLALACSALRSPAQAQQAAPPAPAAPTQTVAIDFPRKVEAYLRDLFALGPNVAIKIGNPAPAALPGLVQVSVELSSAGQSNTVPFFATPDARFILRGDLFDSTTDPFAVNRSKMKLENYPSRGPANAPVTVVEYADLQCPSCKQMHAVLNQILPRYPQVRYVFKDLPLTSIHPWAMTAATAGRCAFAMKLDAFWKLQDAFFTNQETISTADVWTKSIQFAVDAGLEEQSFKQCMTSPEAKAFIEASVNEARALNVANTPTTFVNGRRIVGPDAESLEQYIRYELSKVKPAAPPPPAPKP
jgi:protein-disulfide isomerase